MAYPNYMNYYDPAYAAYYQRVLFCINPVRTFLPLSCKPINLVVSMLSPNRLPSLHSNQPRLLQQPLQLIHTRIIMLNKKPTIKLMVATFHRMHTYIFRVRRLNFLNLQVPGIQMVSRPPPPKPTAPPSTPPAASHPLAAAPAAPSHQIAQKTTSSSLSPNPLEVFLSCSCLCQFVL